MARAMALALGAGLVFGGAAMLIYAHAMPETASSPALQSAAPAASDPAQGPAAPPGPPRPAGELSRFGMLIRQHPALAPGIPGAQQGLGWPVRAWQPGELFLFHANLVDVRSSSVSFVDQFGRVEREIDTVRVVAAERALWIAGADDRVATFEVFAPDGVLSTVGVRGSSGGVWYWETRIVRSTDLAWSLLGVHATGPADGIEPAMSGVWSEGDCSPDGRGDGLVLLASSTLVYARPEAVGGALFGIRRDRAGPPRKFDAENRRGEPCSGSFEGTTITFACGPADGPSTSLVLCARAKAWPQAVFPPQP